MSTHSCLAPTTSALSTEGLWAPLEREFVGITIKKEESPICPYGDKRASLTSSRDNLDHENLTEFNEEEQLSTSLAPPQIEEPPLIISCHEDPVAIPPPTSHPNHQLENSISDLEIEHIEMVLPLCYKTEKEMV